MSDNPFLNGRSTSAVRYPKIEGEGSESRKKRIVADMNDQMWFNADPGKRRTDIEWFCDKGGSHYLSWRT